MQQLMLYKDDSGFAAAYTLYELGITEGANVEAVFDSCIDKHSLSMRERIARRDVDFATSRFGGIGEYIARRNRVHGP